MSARCWSGLWLPGKPKIKTVLNLLHAHSLFDVRPQRQFIVEVATLREPTDATARERFRFTLSELIFQRSVKWCFPHRRHTGYATGAALHCNILKGCNKCDTCTTGKKLFKPEPVSKTQSVRKFSKGVARAARNSAQPVRRAARIPPGDLSYVDTSSFPDPVRKVNGLKSRGVGCLASNNSNFSIDFSSGLVFLRLVAATIEAFSQPNFTKYTVQFISYFVQHRNLAQMTSKEDMEVIAMSLIANGDTAAALTLFECMQRTPIERPITPPVRLTLRGLSNEECRAQFRFVRADIQSIIHLLRLPAIIITRERTRAHVEEAMCVLLERLAFPCRWAALTKQYQRSQSGLSNIFNHMLASSSHRTAPLLEMDLARIGPQVEAYSAAVSAKGAMVSGVWGFVDGTVRGVCRPGDGTAQRSIYNGHKRKHAATFQSVVLPDGIIGHLYGPVRGNTHDIRMLRRSKLEHRIAQHPSFRGFGIYGDPAYGRSDVFASPFRTININEAQVRVNASMSKVRVSVE